MYIVRYGKYIALPYETHYSPLVKTVIYYTSYHTYPSTAGELTCRFHSSVMRDICIFLRPMVRAYVAGTPCAKGTPEKERYAVNNTKWVKNVRYWKERT